MMAELASNPTLSLASGQTGRPSGIGDLQGL